MSLSIRHMLLCLTFALLFCGAADAAQPVLSADGTIHQLVRWRGHTWLGTAGGLQQVALKGQSIRVIRTWGTRQGLPSLQVRALLPQGQRLWIGTEKGLSVLRPKGTLHKVASIKRIRAMVWWKRSLWVATFGHGLYRVSPKGRQLHMTFSRYEKGPLSQRNRLTSLAVLGGTLWFATAGKGIAQLRRASRRPLVQWWDHRKGLPGVFVFRLLTHGRHMFIGTSQGLAKLTASRGVFRLTRTWRASTLVAKGFLPSIMDLAWQPDKKGKRGRLWLCSIGGKVGPLGGPVQTGRPLLPGLPRCHFLNNTLWVTGQSSQRSSGLYALSPSKRSVIIHYKRSGLGSPNVATMLWHRRTLWVGTFARGLYVYKRGRWRHHKEVYRQINHMLSDTAGTLWVATNRGLYRKRRRDRRFRRIYRGPCDLHTNALSANNTHLAVASVSGVAVYHFGRRRWTCFNKHKGLRHKHFFATLLTPKGTLWVGGSDGLVSRDLTQRRGRWRFYSTLQRHLPDDWVTTLYWDRGTIWVGTYAKGLASYDTRRQQWQQYHNTRKLFINPNAALRVGTDRYFGTMQGLLRLRGAKAHKKILTTHHGLTGNDVTALAPTTKGIWVATRSGVSFHKYH